MAVTLTVGTNSYISIDDADLYFDERLYSDVWRESDDDTKAQALITATRQIDRQKLVGKKYLTTQTLQFPRVLTSNRYWETDDETYLSSVDSEVPQAVIDACCEQALFLLSLTDYERHRLKQHALGVVGGSVGSANEYAAESLVKANRSGPVLCPEARQMLQQFTAGTVPIL